MLTTRAPLLVVYTHLAPASVVGADLLLESALIGDQLLLQGFQLVQGFTHVRAGLGMQTREGV